MDPMAALEGLLPGLGTRREREVDRRREREVGGRREREVGERREREVGERREREVGRRFEHQVGTVGTACGFMSPRGRALKEFVSPLVGRDLGYPSTPGLFPAPTPDGAYPTTAPGWSAPPRLRDWLHTGKDVCRSPVPWVPRGGQDILRIVKE